MNVDIIILAAGQGKRMQSSLPKVLQSLGGKPLLQHVIDTCSKLEKVKLHIVVGSQKKLIQSSSELNKSGFIDKMERFDDKKYHFLSIHHNDYLLLLVL